jgi:hypothetical protein
MSHRHGTFTPSLRSFISKVLTPAVLVLGVLLLIYFNFNSVLKAAQITNDQFNGLVAFNQGNFAYRFQENAGIDRPALRYAGINVLSYSEWSSIISIDGDVQELWNNFHGYDVDQNKRQLYSTISGDRWQLIEIVSLVNDHTVTVAFNFTTRPASLPSPVHYVFDITHITSPGYEWYNIQTANNSFTAQVIQGTGVPTRTSTLRSYGTLSFSATGPALYAPAITLKNSTTVTGSRGTLTLGQAFYTEYQVTNPTPFRMITLGTETLIFKPSSTSPGAPAPGVVPLPGQ